MKYCKYCKVEVDEKERACPLCQCELEVTDEKSGMTDYYIKKESRKKRKITFDKVVNISVSVVLVLLGLFCVVNFAFGLLPWLPAIAWVLFGIFCVLYFVDLVCHTILSKRNIIEKIIFQSVLLILIGWICQWISNDNAYVLNYVIPCVGILAIHSLNTIMFLYKDRCRLIVATFLTNVIYFVISLLFIVLHVALLPHFCWILLVYSSINILWLLIFKWKKLKEGFARTAHI